jgi:hypothetical protein
LFNVFNQYAKVREIRINMEHRDPSSIAEEIADMFQDRAIGVLLLKVKLGLPLGNLVSPLLLIFTESAGSSPYRVDDVNRRIRY